MTKNLPDEVVLCISNLLLSELDKFSFAFVNKSHWRICSLSTADTLKLENAITALQLRKYRAFIIQNKYYDEKYMKHVFLHAANLHTIIIDNREKCTFNFTLFLLQCANKRKKLTFIVPEGFERKFRFIVEEDEISHIKIKISGDEQPVDVSKIVTPEAVRTQIERAKDILKREYYLANKETVVMKDSLSHMIASPINRFFNSKEYFPWKNDFGGDSLMKKTDLNAVEARRIVNEYGPKFVESVVILENYWFLMTSFSFFIHNNLQIDDCADLSKVGYQEKAVAFIRKKTRFGKDYFELTYRFGHVELLATSGFFGSVDGTFFFPFLGSSIQKLPTAITESFETISTNVVFITIEQKEYICKNRIMNQYYKLNARNNWGFHSKRYEDKGFSPANPLSFENNNIMYSAASLVIRSFAYQEIQQKQINKLLPKVLAQDDSSLTYASKLTKKFLVFLNKHQNSSFSLSPPKETKKELIEIYNNSPAGALKSSNIKNIKLAKKRYEAKKIDLFGEE